jgi:AcrR family transcriptional regulator
MPRSGARLPKSEATRLKLLDCAAEEILELGPDRIGFTSIARRAELSTGALYARYENVDELLLEVWMHRGLPTLRRLVADMEESLVLPAGKDARQRIAQQLRKPDPDLALLTKLLMIARRNEAVGEFVIPSTVDVVEKARASTPAFDFYLGQILGITMGVQSTGFTGLDWLAPVNIVASSVRDAVVAVKIDPSSPAIPETGTSGPELDDTDARLFSAVTRVISRVGVDNATVSRIARHADINPASIYLRYEDKEALLAACIAHTMASTYSENERLVAHYTQDVDSQKGQGANRYGVIMFRGNQSEDHKEMRRLRLETIFGAAHHADLKKITHDTFMEILTHDGEKLGVRLGSLPKEQFVPLLVFNRFSFFGYALLREFGFLGPEHEQIVSFFEQIGERMFSAATRLPRS